MTGVRFCSQLALIKAATWSFTVRSCSGLHRANKDMANIAQPFYEQCHVMKYIILRATKSASATILACCVVISIECLSLFVVYRHGVGSWIWRQGGRRSWHAGNFLLSALDVVMPQVLYKTKFGFPDVWQAEHCGSEQTRFSCYGCDKQVHPITFHFFPFYKCF